MKERTFFKDELILDKNSLQWEKRHDEQVLCMGHAALWGVPSKRAGL